MRILADFYFVILYTIVQRMNNLVVVEFILKDTYIELKHILLINIIIIVNYCKQEVVGIKFVLK